MRQTRVGAPGLARDDDEAGVDFLLVRHAPLQNLQAVTRGRFFARDRAAREIARFRDQHGGTGGVFFKLDPAILQRAEESAALRQGLRVRTDAADQT